MKFVNVVKNPSGSVGIGVSEPLARLYVTGSYSTYEPVAIFREGYAQQSGSVLSVQNVAGSPMLFVSGSSVGIGTAAVSGSSTVTINSRKIFVGDTASPEDTMLPEPFYTKSIGVRQSLEDTSSGSLGAVNFSLNTTAKLTDSTRSSYGLASTLLIPSGTAFTNASGGGVASAGYFYARSESTGSVGQPTNAWLAGIYSLSYAVNDQTMGSRLLGGYFSGIYNGLGGSTGGNPDSHGVFGSQIFATARGGTHSNAGGIYTGATITSASTTTNVYGIRAYAALNGTSSTITNTYGGWFQITKTAGTVTNAYGLYVNDVSSIGTNNYALYSAGGKSYHAGSIGVGTTLTDAKLHVDNSSTNGFAAGTVAAASNYTGIKIVNTSTTNGRSVLVLGEDSLSSGATPFVIERYGSTNATNPNLTNISNTGPLTISTGGSGTERLRVLSTGNTAFTGSLEPGSDITYNIGSETKRWNNVYASYLTGSLTKLRDGTSYLIAGNNVTILTGTNGAVTISSNSPAGTITGTGTTNYVAKFTGTSTIGDGVIYDTGTNVGIGTTTPVSTGLLTISGTVVTKYGTGYESYVANGGHTAGTSGFYPFIASGFGSNDTVVKYANGNNNFVVMHGTTPVISAGGTNLVSIGEGSYSARLFVSGSSTSTTPTMIVREGVLNPTGGAGVFNVQNSVGTSLLFVSGSGAVGIGTTVSQLPTHRLHVAGKIGGGLYIDSSLEFLTNGTTELKANSVLKLGYLLTTVINSSGNVGIGTISPSVRLDVSGSYAVGVERARIWGPLNLKYSTDTLSGKDYQIGSGYELDGTAHGAGGFVLYHRWGDSGLGNGGWKMIFGSASTPTLTMVNQTVGIGTTIMSAKLHVQGSTTTSVPTVYIRENQASADATAILDVQNSSGTSILFVTGSGHVGIGTNVPSVYAGYTVLNIGRSGATGLLKFKSSYGSGNGAELYQATDGRIILSANSSSGLGIVINPTSKLFDITFGAVSNYKLVTAGLVSSGTVEPAFDVTYDLGTTTKRWNNIYAASISGSLTGSNVSAGQVVVAGTGGVLSGSNNFWWDNSLGRVGIGTNSPTYDLQIGSLGTFGARSLFLTDLAYGLLLTGGGTGARIQSRGTGVPLELQAGNSNDGNYWFSSTGRFGIGNTNNPVARFTVTGSSTTTVPTMIVREATSMASGVALVDVQSSTGTSVFFITGSGNVGIGTNNPAQRLHVVGATYSTSFVYSDSYSSFTEFRIRNDENNRLYRNGTDFIMTSAAGYSLAFLTNNGSERVRITSGGTVGVTGSLEPGQDLNFNLGSTTKRWANIYAANISGSLTGSNVSAGQVVVAGAGGVLSGSNNLWWDNASQTVGIGTSTLISGRSLTTVSDISVNGVRVGTGNTSDITCTAVGNAALNTNAGNFNTAVGQSSLFSNSTGTLNVAVGREALRNCVNGTNNTAVGSSALRQIVATSNAIGFGNDAGRYAGSGATVNTSAADSIFLGADTRASASGNSNEIVIGKSAIGNGSNTTTIGNASTVTTYLAGNVGLGTTNPDSRLTVSGSLDLATFYNSAGVKRLTVQNSGDLSFNTSTALGLVWGTASLKFNGQANGAQVLPFASNYVGFSVIGRASQTYALQTWQDSSGNVLSVVDAAGNVGLGITTVSSTLSARLIVSGSSVASAQTMLVKGGTPAQTGPVFEVEDYLGTTLLVVSGSGNVGIGSTSPDARLDVNDGANGRFRIGGTAGTAIISDFDNFAWRSSNTFTSFAQLNATGLGIGMSAPSARLFVSGSSTATTPTTILRSGLFAPSSAILDVQNTAGTSMFWVSGSSGTGNAFIRDNLYMGPGSNKYVVGVDSGGNPYHQAYSIHYFMAASTYKMVVNSNGVSINNSSTAAGTGMGLVVATGNVGIGTTTTGDKLAVNGSMSVTGSLLPGDDNTWDLGSSSPQKRWKNLYATSISGSLTGSNLTAGQVVVAGTGGVLSGSNNFWWDNSSQTVGIGTSTLISGRSLTTVSDISVNGVRVGTGNTSDITCTAVGNAALNTNAGNFNTAVGQSSLFSNNTGTLNVAVGREALRNCDNGTNNTAVGSSALRQIAATSNAIGFGNNAGRYAGSGTTVNTSAADSIFLGADTRASASGNSNEIVIGKSAIGNGSNTTTIGNSSTVITYLAGNVGIGTTNPAARLVVSGSSTSSAQTMLVKGGTPAQTGPVFEVEDYLGTTLMVVSGSGNVGIGTNNPTDTASWGRTLDIRGSSASNGSVAYFGGSDATTRAYFGFYATNYGFLGTQTAHPLTFWTSNVQRATIDTNGNVGIGTDGPTNYASYNGLTINDTNGGFIYLRNTANTAAFEQLASATETYIKNISNLPLWFGSNNIERLRITTDSGFPVYVSAAANQAIRVNSATSNSAFLATFNDFASIGANRNPASGVFADTSKAAAEIAISGGSTSSVIVATAATVNTVPTERMRIDGSGNVGIGTNNANGNRLAVNGDMSITGSILPFGDAARDLGSPTYRWRNLYATSISGSLTGSNLTAGQVVVAGTVGVLSGSNNFWWDNSLGRVGIGTSSPGFTLEVNGTFAAATKSFVIQHPLKPGWKLRYGSLESPYHGIRLTGEAHISGRDCVIDLPEYISALCTTEGAQVQITNFGHGKNLWIHNIDVENNRFTVRTSSLMSRIFKKKFKFFWSFTAIRKDVPSLIAEMKNE